MIMIDSWIKRRMLDVAQGLSINVIPSIESYCPMYSKTRNDLETPCLVLPPLVQPQTKIRWERGTFTLFWPLLATLVLDQWICVISPGACFSKVPKLFGPISGATIAFISTQCRGSRPSNFAILLVFLTLKTWKKAQVFKTTGFQFDN